MTGGRRAAVVAAAAIAASVPATAHADMVWPALLLEFRLLSLPVIALGLLVEAAVLRSGFGMRWSRAVFAACVVNAASTALGVVLVPLAGLVWEIFAGFVVYSLLPLGTFNPFGWIATFLVAVAVTTGLEVVCLKQAFGVPPTRRTWKLWALANAASVGLAFAGLLLEPFSRDFRYHLWLVR